MKPSPKELQYMDDLLRKISACEECKASLPLGPRPVMAAHPASKIIIIGQAPGKKVHESGIPWNDPSGNQLRRWMGISEADFYDPKKIAILPMGFCYPGKGTSGDLPPRPECAPLWHGKVLDAITAPTLILLIGQYSQQYYLKDAAKKNLTETVRNYKEYLPGCLPLPHPSPRNRFWLAKNPWFQAELVPELKQIISDALR